MPLQEPQNMAHFRPSRNSIVSVRIQIHAVRNAQALALRNVILKIFIILVGIITAIANAKDGKRYAVGLYRFPIDALLMLTHINALSKRAGNDGSAVLGHKTRRRKRPRARSRGTIRQRKHVDAVSRRAFRISSIAIFAFRLFSCLLFSKSGVVKRIRLSRQRHERRRHYHQRCRTQQHAQRNTNKRPSRALKK